MEEALRQLLRLTMTGGEANGPGWNDSRFHCLAAMSYTEGAANWYAQAAGREEKFGPPDRGWYTMTDEDTRGRSPADMAKEAQNLAAKLLEELDAIESELSNEQNAGCWSHIRAGLENSHPHAQYEHRYSYVTGGPTRSRTPSTSIEVSKWSSLSRTGSGSGPWQRLALLD